MSRNAVIVILSILVAVNAFWFFMSGLTGPLIGMVFYAILFYLCIYKKHIQAGIIGGIAGFAIHIIELMVFKGENLGAVGLLCLVINLILPAALAYFSYKAFREAG